MSKVIPEGGFRSPTESEVGKRIAEIFAGNENSVEENLEHFPKFIRRQRLTRLLALYEIFKRILPIKGSIVECGVYKGFGLMSWANFSAVLEPSNLSRRIYGFDSFEGFPQVGEKDLNKTMTPKRGQLRSNSYEELNELIQIYDSNRFLGHVPKVQLIKGDVVKTIPQFIEQNKHLLVSLLFLDFDLFDSTKIAIDTFLPRMPKGAIIAFDELDNPIWPGETMALLETIRINQLNIERLDFDPYIGFAVVN